MYPGTVVQLKMEILHIRRMPHGTLRCAGCDRWEGLIFMMADDPRKGVKDIRERYAPSEVWENSEYLQRCINQGLLILGQHG